MNNRIPVLFLLPTSLVAACGAVDPKDGSLAIAIYGEAFIEEGIPATEFADGWAITFDTFLVSLHSVAAGSGSAAPALSSTAGWVFDLAQSSRGAGFPVLSGMVAGGTYNNVRYRIAPAQASYAGGNASAAQRQALVAAGGSLQVVGSAQKGMVKKSFDWVFTTDTEYAGCHGTGRVDGGMATTQLTIHGDHLFYDDLVAEAPDLSFGLIAAADTDGDHVITQAELDALDISSQARYRPGVSGVTTLWGYLAAATGTLGHIDGEGHCDSTTRR